MVKTILKYVGLLAMVPLFTMILAVDYVGEADAKKAEGSPGHVPPKRYGSATEKIVCGDKLCSELEDEETNAVHFRGSE